MRFKKGSKVEVFQSTKSSRYGFWRPAQILCGNGRTYSVQYATQTSEIEKVPRKSIRPCPPLKEKPINWAIGDVAEVLIHGSWRNARVTGVDFGNNFIFVNSIDESREFAVKRNNVRLRQIWQNDKWVTIKKDLERINEMKKRKLDDFDIRAEAKRPRLEFEKVIQGENYMNNNSCESESTVSSTGSCSTSGRPGNYVSFSWANDDAMSSCEPVKENENNGEELLSKIEWHKIELDAYIATLSEFYKNGSISWEQEENLSNMRLDLNISFDEHRFLLRNAGPSSR